MPNFSSLSRRLVTLILAIGLSGCSLATTKAPRMPGDVLRVVTTIGMIEDIVKNIGGKRVSVISLMGPGVDPHLYKPSLGDVRSLDTADVIFYGGLHLEGRMVDLFEKMQASGIRAEAVSENIDPALLRQPAEFEGNYDPHIWFDVTLWQRAAQHVAAVLIEIDPDSTAYYQNNAAAYQQELAELHSYVTTQINSIPATSRVLITAHDAFGYFGQRYGMDVRGVQGSSTASEASASAVSELAGYIAAQKIKAIFVESSVPATTIQALQAAVRARGWQVQIGGELFADAMGAAGTPEGTYVGMVKHNVDTIVTALR